MFLPSALNWYVGKVPVASQYAAFTCSLSMRGPARGGIGDRRQARKQSKNCICARADCKEDLGLWRRAWRAQWAGVHAAWLRGWQRFAACLHVQLPTAAAWGLVAAHHVLV